MADTSFLKNEVETYVRSVLSAEYHVGFSSRVLTLTTGGTHEFDAVSADGRYVASIKSASGKTSGGNVPSGKVKDLEAELYYLTLVGVPHRLLVVTNPEFFKITSRRLIGRLAPGITLKLIELPEPLGNAAHAVQVTASREVSPGVHGRPGLAGR